MKTKTEFVDAYADLFAGFLLSAFTQAEKPDMTEKGRFMNMRLKEVRPLLEKMHDFISEVKPEPVKTTIETLEAELAKQLSAMAPEAKEKCRERLRPLFNTNGKGAK